MNADPLLVLREGETAGPFVVEIPDWFVGFYTEVYPAWPFWRRRLWDWFGR